MNDRVSQQKSQGPGRIKRDIRPRSPGRYDNEFHAAPDVDTDPLAEADSQPSSNGHQAKHASGRVPRKGELVEATDEDRPVKQDKSSTADSDDDEDDLFGAKAETKRRRKKAQRRAERRAKEYPDECADYLVELTHAKHGRVSVPTWVPLIVQGGNERLVLAQLFYWCGPRLNAPPFAQRNDRDGRPTVVKIYAELGDEIGCPDEAVRKASDRLEQMGYIDTWQARSPFYVFQKATHFALNLVHIAEAVREAKAKRQQAEAAKKLKQAQRQQERRENNEKNAEDRSRPRQMKNDKSADLRLSTG